MENNQIYKTFTKDNLPSIPPLPRELSSKYTKEDWDKIHTSKLMYDLREMKLLDVWEFMKTATSNFTKLVTSKDFSSKDFELIKECSTKRTFRTRMLRPSPAKTFRDYLKAIVENNESQIKNLSNYIKGGLSNSDKYMAAIAKRLVNEKDNHFPLDNF
jgi:hypothetical protein